MKTASLIGISVQFSLCLWSNYNLFLYHSTSKCPKRQCLKKNKGKHGKQVLIYSQKAGIKNNKEHKMSFQMAATWVKMYFMLCVLDTTIA